MFTSKQPCEQALGVHHLSHGASALCFGCGSRALNGGQRSSGEVIVGIVARELVQELELVWKLWKPVGSIPLAHTQVLLVARCLT